jgi:hypothetical protein
MFKGNTGISREALVWMFGEGCVDLVEEYKDVIVYCNDAQYVYKYIKSLGREWSYKNIVQMRWLCRHLEGIVIDDYQISLESKCSEVALTHNIWCGKARTQIQEQCQRHGDEEQTLEVRIMCDFSEIYSGDYYEFADDDDLRDELILQIYNGAYKGDKVLAFYNRLMEDVMINMHNQLKEYSNRKAVEEVVVLPVERSLGERVVSAYSAFLSTCIIILCLPVF